MVSQSESLLSLLLGAFAGIFPHGRELLHDGVLHPPPTHPPPPLVVASNNCFDHNSDCYAHSPSHTHKQYHIPSQHMM